MSTNHSVFDNLKHIAIKNNWKFRLDEEEAIAFFRFSSGDKELWVNLILKDDTWFAYGLSSDGLPREIYADSLQNDFTEEQRSSEIMKTVDQLFSKSLAFHRSPSFLNKSKGYIVLNIDGKTSKALLKQNYFQLPSVTN